MKVLIFGASGWLGGQYLNYFDAKDGLEVRPGDADITDPEAVETALDCFRPDWVINAAGMTHGQRFNNIDGCEEDEFAKQMCVSANIRGPINIANYCEEYGARMIHLSSGNIFDGHPFGGFKEEAEPTPLNHYYWTKAEAEKELTKWYDDVLILRAMLPVNGQFHERNLIYKLAHAEQVADVTSSLTVVSGLMLATWELMKRRVAGIYNVVNPYPIDYSCIMKMYCDLVNPNHAGKYRLVKDFKTTAPRSNAVLSTEKLSGEGIYLQPTEAAVRECLLSYARNLRMLALG